MMLTLVACLSVVAAAPSSDAAAFKAAYAQWQDERTLANEEAAERALKGWRAAKPDDIAMLIAAANLRSNQAIGAPGAAESAPRFASAIADLTRALELDPTRLDVHFGLMAVLRMADRRSEIEAKITAMLAMVSSRSAKQLKWLDGKPLKEPVASFVPLNVIGVIDQSDFEYVPALRVLEALLAQYPKCGECWNARAAFTLGKNPTDPQVIEQSLESLRKAAALLPKDQMVKANLGATEIQAGHEAEGMALLEAVWRAKPADREMEKIAHFAGPVWARLSPLKFHEQPLDQPPKPTTLPDGGVFVSGLIRGQHAFDTESMSAREVATIYCENQQATPCSQWNAYARAVIDGAEADLKRLKAFLADLKTSCRDRRAAMFAFEKAWPDAEERQLSDATEMFFEMKPCR